MELDFSAIDLSSLSNKELFALEAKIKKEVEERTEIFTPQVFLEQCAQSVNERKDDRSFFTLITGNGAGGRLYDYVTKSLGLSLNQWLEKTLLKSGLENITPVASLVPLTPYLTEFHLKW